jgi:hypothetical protein
MATVTPETTAAEATQKVAWSKILELGERARRDRAGAIADLEAMFRTGRPSESIDGATEGRLVTFTVHPRFDNAVAALTGRWMPWAGKRFNAAEKRGDNLIARSARIPARILWPLYAMKEAGTRLTAFDFNTWIEPGAVNPDMDVLVIDYASVDSNPRLVIKQIRDELVEVAPGAHLGKMLWRQGSGPKTRYTLLAFFALKSELPG